MTIQILKQLHDSGQFHHATYRNIGKVWEGLYIYRKSTTGLRGFELAGCFNAHMDKDALKEAESMIRRISVGSYGNG